MSYQNEEIISEYKDKILIVETPKKGGVGLNDSFRNIVSVVKKLHDGKDSETIRNESCFK